MWMGVLDIRSTHHIGDCIVCIVFKALFHALHSMDIIVWSAFYGYYYMKWNLCIVLHVFYSMFCIICLHCILCLCMCSLCMVVYAFNSMHCILRNVFCALNVMHYSIHCIPFIAFYGYILWIECTVLNALYFLHSIVCIVFYVLYFMFYILCNVCFALYFFHCIICIGLYASH